MKIHRILFGGLVTLVAGTIIGGVGLNSANHFSKSSKVVSFTSQKNLSLDVKQQNSIGENKVKDSTKDLKFEYQPIVNGYTVTGFKSEAQIDEGYTLIIPEKYNGSDGSHDVKAIGANAFNAGNHGGNGKIKQIDCGKVETIGDAAFKSCQNLEWVTFSENLKELGRSCFEGCSRLKCITFPETSNLQVGGRAFVECSGIEKIVALCDDGTRSPAFDSNWLYSQEPQDGSKKTLYVLHDGVAEKMHIVQGSQWDVKKVTTTITTKTKDFVVLSDGGAKRLIGLTSSAKSKENLTIPVEINSIDNYAFVDHSKDLTYITFPEAQTPIEARNISDNAFSSLPDSVRYRINFNNRGQEFTSARALSGKKQIIYKNDGDFIKQTTLGGASSPDTSYPEIGGLTEEGKNKKDNLTVTEDITHLGAYAFSGCEASNIEFKQGDKIEKIDNTAFEHVSAKTIYHTNTDDKAEVVTKLKELVNQENIAVTVKQDKITREITLGGILTKARVAAETNAASNSTSKELNDSNVLTIEEKIGNITLKGIGHKAFQNCSDIKRVEFTKNVAFSDGKLYGDSFDDLKKEDAVICAYDAIVVKKITDVYGGKIGTADGDFFYDNRSKTSTVLGLTQQGRSAKSLHINTGTVANDAFFGCSKNVAITIDSGVKFEDNAIRSIPKDVLDSIKWDVKGNSSVREYLKGKVPEKNIKYTAGGLSGPIIGTIIGSICAAIIILGLGIGIPMRKQNKINVLNAKLTHKRIDKLSTANSLAFKKVIEVTGSLDKKVDRISSGLKALKAASRPTKPAVKKADGTTTSATTVVKKAAAPKAATAKTTATKVVAAKTTTEAAKEEKK